MIRVEPEAVVQGMTDVQRAVWGLLGLATLALILATVYRNPYLFQDPLGVGLPDVNVPASRLTLGFQIAAGMALLWALLLAGLSTAAYARAFRTWWYRSVKAEVARPRAIVFALMLAVAYAAARMATNGETLNATLEMLTVGEARTPFQYRTLVPWLVRPLFETFPSLPLDWVYGFFEAVAAFGVYAAFVLLLRSFVADRAARRLAALVIFLPLVLNLATPHRYNAIFFPYDTLSVAFFTAGLAFMLRRDWRLIYPLFVIATLNRETTCFLAIAYLFLAWGEERPTRIISHLVALAVLWIGVKGGLHVIYEGNEPLDIVTGGLFSNQLARSTRILTTVPGLVYILLTTMGGAGAVVLLLQHRIREVHLRRLFGIVPLFLIGMAVVGELLEVRIYSELIPLVTLALLLIVRSVVEDTEAQPVESTHYGRPPGWVNSRSPWRHLG